MTRRHVVSHDLDGLHVARMHVVEPEVVADLGTAVDADAIGDAVRAALDDAPVGLLTRTGLLHVREDRRARLHTSIVVDDGEREDGAAVALVQSLSVGSAVVWSAVAVGSLDGALTDEVTGLTALLATDLTAAWKATDVNVGADADR